MFQFHAISTDNGVLAWRAFAAAASEFGALVPTALAAYMAAGNKSIPAHDPDSVRIFLETLHDDVERGMDEQYGCSGIGVLPAGELPAGDPHLYDRTSCHVVFGTGRSCVKMDIWAPVEGSPTLYWLWCEGQMDGVWRDPSAYESLATSLRRRWMALRSVMPEPEPEPVEVFRRSAYDGLDRDLE